MLEFVIPCFQRWFMVQYLSLMGIVKLFLNDNGLLSIYILKSSIAVVNFLFLLSILDTSCPPRLSHAVFLVIEPRIP